MATLNVESVEFFEKSLSDRGCNVVHFWAPWAPQCQQMQEVVEELAKESDLKNVKFLKVEAEAIPELSHKYSIIAVPTFIFIKNNKLVDRVDGANAPELTKKVQQHCQAGFVPPSLPTLRDIPKEDIKTMLSSLIKREHCMLFMKGTPEQPRCGFSKQIIAMLQKYDAKFGTFDILGDEEVRQELKTYSNWPTYPQLYINGELIGGIDIVKEMDDSGELDTVLPKKMNLNDRLKYLINKAPIMLFIKGSATVPRCGFSKTLVEMFDSMSVKYDTFDIIQDEEVRQGLKNFSNWPTYPQVYVNGELIGGLDIIKELKESGELETTLTPTKLKQED